MLYAFNLEVARVRETVSESLIGQMRLQWWREAIGDFASGKIRAHPVAEALAATLAEAPIRPALIERILTAREFDLLVYLVEHPGRVFSREQLLDSALGFSDFSDTRGVDVHVRHLREKLGDDATAPRFVETVRGVGYRVKRDAT